MANFLFNHGGHHIWHAQARCQLGAAADHASPAIDIPVFISSNPVVLSCHLSDHRPGIHRCVDFIAGAIKPVLIKATRDFASRIHSFKLTVVRRSSSIMPILIVFLTTKDLQRPQKYDSKGDFF